MREKFLRNSYLANDDLVTFFKISDSMCLMEIKKITATFVPRCRKVCFDLQCDMQRYSADLSYRPYKRQLDAGWAKNWRERRGLGPHKYSCKSVHLAMRYPRAHALDKERCDVWEFV